MVKDKIKNALKRFKTSCIKLKNKIKLKCSNLIKKNSRSNVEGSRKFSFNYYELPLHLIFVVLFLMGYWFIPVIYYSLVLIYLFLRWCLAQNLFKVFRTHSVMISGQKGTGKDLLTQAYINSYKNISYYSNINYGGNFHELDFNDLKLGNNTYEDFINRTITKLDDYKIKEGSDVIMSDGGVYFPSHYDTLLSKKYPSLPIFTALSRQLSDTNLIINCQQYGRVWVKFREHFDNYVLCKKTTSKGMQKLLKIFPILNKYLFITCYYYENQESFETKKLPFKQSGLLSRNNALYSTTADTLKKEYDYVNGKIQKFVIPIKKSKITYDTRYFAKMLFNDDLLKERGLLNDNNNN